MTTADSKKITLSVDAADYDSLKAAAALEGVSVSAYCMDALDHLLNENGGAHRGGGEPISHETLDGFDALRKEIFGDKKFPGNSADAIREMREERTLQLERASKGR